MDPARSDLDSVIHDVLAGRAGRKKPSTVGELQMIVAEVINQRSSSQASGWVPVTTGGLSENSVTQFVAILEELQKEGFLETRWRAGDLQDVTFTITEKGLRSQQGGDVLDPRPSGQPGQQTATPSTSENRKVFVIHGRNNAAREALVTFLRAIGLHPLEWSEIVRETGKASPYTGEVLEKGFNIAQAVVVLLTPDDEARLKEQFRAADDPAYEADLSPQPRPNVLIEAGMALGLHRDRTVIVELGQLRPVSNLFGREVVRMDNSAEQRNHLAQRLITSGCAANLTGTDWLSNGDFEAAIFPLGQPGATSSGTQLRRDADAVEHDRRIFSEADSLLSEIDLRNLIDQLGNEHSYTRTYVRHADDFCRFFGLEQNQYLTPGLSALCNSLRRALLNLLRFTAREFHLYPKDQVNRFCMAPSLNMNRDGSEKPEEAVEYDRLTLTLNKLLDDVEAAFRLYRRKIKEILAV